MARYNDVRVKAGFDQTLTDSDNVEGFTPTGGNPQRFKLARAGMVYFGLTERVYREGEERLHPDGSVSFVGLETVTYEQPGCHPDAYAWLISNYRGDVTCYVPRDGTTYARYNARLRFEKSPSQIMAGWYEVRWIFSLVEAL